MPQFRLATPSNAAGEARAKGTAWLQRDAMPPRTVAMGAAPPSPCVTHSGTAPRGYSMEQTRLAQLRCLLSAHDGTPRRTCMWYTHVIHTCDTCMPSAGVNVLAMLTCHVVWDIDDTAYSGDVPCEQSTESVPLDNERTKYQCGQGEGRVGEHTT